MRPFASEITVPSREPSTKALESSEPDERGAMRMKPMTEAKQVENADHGENAEHAEEKGLAQLVAEKHEHRRHGYQRRAKRQKPGSGAGADLAVYDRRRLEFALFSARLSFAMRRDPLCTNHAEE